MTRKLQCAIVAAAFAVALTAVPAASGFVIGAGSRPGLTVDPAGTAYIAWSGTETTNTSLRFCRLPRGATGCDAAAASVLPAPATSASLSRPFITVSGDRVVVLQFRYPTAGPVVEGVYRFTSVNGGVSFDPPQIVGSVAFEEAVAGPGDTLSGVPEDGDMSYQNVVLSGDAPLSSDGRSAVPKAVLSVTHQNQAGVGLIDAASPLAVFTAGANAQFRRYNGNGALNDIANWSPAADIGVASYPELAGGPSGLFLLAGDNSVSLFSRKWNGTDFGPPVTIGPGSTPSKHLFQDAAGRLHAVFQRDSANPLQLIHAVSDDGLTWRQGTLVTQDIAEGGISDLRVATAADHIGVTVWHAGTGAGDIRVAALGPDAPVTVAPPLVVKPKPTLTASGSAKRSNNRVLITVKATLVLPKGVARADGCNGKVKVTVKRADKAVATRTISLGKGCVLSLSVTVARSKVKRSKKLALRLRFSGNAALAAVTKAGSINVKD